MRAPISIDPVELVLKVALAQQGAAESPPASNAGPYVELNLAAVGLPKGQPWCAAMVARTGRIALDKAWPLPMTGGCQVLGDFARAHGILFETPERGDLWLHWSDALQRFAHVGLVLSAEGAHIDVFAGNTIKPGQKGDLREGWLAWPRTEAIGAKDRFVRWVHLL